MTHATLAPFESRTSNLLERLFLEKRRTRIIPHAFCGRVVLNVISAAVIRTADRWLGIRVGDFGTAISVSPKRSFFDCDHPVRRRPVFQHAQDLTGR
jgi:hypothetical protein